MSSFQQFRLSIQSALSITTGRSEGGVSDKWRVFVDGISLATSTASVREMVSDCGNHRGPKQDKYRLRVSQIEILRRTRSRLALSFRKQAPTPTLRPPPPHNHPKNCKGLQTRGVARGSLSPRLRIFCRRGEYQFKCIVDINEISLSLPGVFVCLHAGPVSATPVPRS